MTSSTIVLPVPRWTIRVRDTVTGPSSRVTPSGSRRERGLGDLAGHLGDVGLVHLVRRVRQPLREVAVVGQDDQPGGVGVEPADVEEPLGPVGDHVGQRAAALGVGHRRDHAARLVEHEVDVRRDRRQPLAVDPDHRGARVDLGAEPGDDLAVDLDHAGEHQLLAACAARPRRTGRAASAAGSARRRRGPGASRGLGAAVRLGARSLFRRRVRGGSPRPRSPARPPGRPGRAGTAPARAARRSTGRRSAPGSRWWCGRGWRRCCRPGRPPRPGRG